MTKALLIIDMLNDFVPQEGYESKLPVTGAETLVENIAAIKAQAEQKGYVVVYANDSHPEDSEEFKLWPVHCIKGTYGAEVVEGLEPGQAQVFEKDSLDVFTNQEFDCTMRQQGVDEFYVVGVATEYCDRAVVLGALQRGYKVNLVVDAIAGVDEIVLPDGNAVPGTKGAVANALMEMAAAGAKPVYTARALEELI